MNSLTYQLAAGDTRLTHGADRSRIIGDIIDHRRPDRHTDAQVASGDVLITLATTLDSLTGLMKRDPRAAIPQLEATIHTLLYLQRHYKLTRKHPQHRQ